jgi:transcription elongation factor Elf1
MSAKIRHCPRCKSKNIERISTMPDVKMGTTIVWVYCRDCCYRTNLQLRVLKRRKGGF